MVRGVPAWIYLYIGSKNRSKKLLNPDLIPVKQGKRDKPQLNNFVFNGVNQLEYIQLFIRMFLSPPPF